MARLKQMLRLENVSDGETVHQRCVLITGQCASFEDGEDFLSIQTLVAYSPDAFPTQNWPVSRGRFKALIVLSPGSNELSIQHHHNDEVQDSMTVTLGYIPLLQYPPLHLAIMVAKDSPLLIDCPPHKRGGFSSAHADLDSAIAKLRMTAYMWQALTAEDLRAKGLGRRSFRFDEEWAVDTLSREFLQARFDNSLETENAMRSTAKIHIIRSSKTTRELRDAQIAQQNPSAQRKNDLFDYFLDALKEAGGPFASSAYPIVAGLILDSHFSPSQDLILAHAALGCHNPDGISLGMFGSHLTYSWPRFLEEVPACLTDTRPPGDKVGNDNGECGTMWEACSIGQGAHLHEVGHAFGSPHRPGIMERGYAQDWPKNFLAKTAYCDHTKSDGVFVTEETPNDARWNLVDALSFKVQAHFRLPTDRQLPPNIRDASPTAQIQYEGDDELSVALVIECAGGIAQIQWQDIADPRPTVAEPVHLLRFTSEELESRFDRAENLRLHVLGMNGREKTVKNVWKLFSNTTFIRVPGTSMKLYKRSVYSDRIETLQENEKVWEWAQLLKEKGRDGNLTPATKIDMRVGAIWDGGVVYYQDGHKSHWGPMWNTGGREHRFGGHASQQIELPPNVEIKKIEVNRGSGYHTMDGVRMHLSNGTVAGELNARGNSNVFNLEPAANETIIGFYGKNDWGRSFDGVLEFGIITAPKNVELPMKVYELPELKNTDGGLGEVSLSVRQR
ncbi:hypothetical protein K432DRAFT_385710 [Lepidopterella palustris CBS 459.81]|uniref:Jacalin-type lectin domain-containing protein n=1 Tax=Lepidopterella palustris CBS 459.81 TaxID=1314670 RepID=A0A8E2E2C3_9PEZI|nr:hypothetical protein K432DRAFT_385710 [Lepidopterella palustris CBS 459.81]